MLGEEFPPLGATEDVRRRPGGRSERIRQDVAEAVLDFFRAGRADFSPAEVAERAGIHRSTVYRRWPTVAALVQEALTQHTTSAYLVAPNTGRWLTDVRALAAQLAEFFDDPVEVSMNAALALGSSPEVDRVVINHWRPIFQQLGETVDRAISRSEVAPDTDPAMVMHLLVGPLILQTTILRNSPGPDFIHRLAAAVANSVAIQGNEPIV